MLLPLSVTVSVMICLPTLKFDFEKPELVLKAPSKLELQAYVTPSSTSEADDANVALSPAFTITSVNCLTVADDMIAVVASAFKENIEVTGTEPLALKYLVYVPAVDIVIENCEFVVLSELQTFHVNV